jgi:hypothetical protein
VEDRPCFVDDLANDLGRGLNRRDETDALARPERQRVDISFGIGPGV